MLIFYQYLVCLKLLEKNAQFFFDLDPAHYLSTPGYSWDAMLRFTDLNLKPISNTERYQFIENTIRVSIL